MAKKEEEKKDDDKPVVEFATKEEFNALKSEIKEMNSEVVGLIKGLSESMKKPDVKDEGGPQTPDAVTEKVSSESGFKHFLPDNYQNIFEKYFDMNDGFMGKVDFPGVDLKGGIQGGIIYTIFVPRKFSNATPAHLDHYKVDLRSKRLSSENTLKSFEDWSKLVAKNIRYDINIVRK